jgi:hypothetical protein
MHTPSSPGLPPIVETPVPGDEEETEEGNEWEHINAALFDGGVSGGGAGRSITPIGNNVQDELRGTECSGLI